MGHAIFPTLLVLTQAVLHDAGPVIRNDPAVRHAVMPGTIDARISPVDGFACHQFVGYAEMQTALNLLQGDLSCSGEVVDQRTGAFRQVNYLPTSAGRLPVVIHSPQGRVDGESRLVIFLTGGPRNIAVTRPLAQRLAAAGYTVLMPIYLGALETRYPAPDLPGAVEQVRALTGWAGKRLVATVGVSTGAYLAAAACTARCAPRVLLAPPLTTPEDIMSDKRVNWAKLHNGYCLWRQNGPARVCADDRPFITSFWGDAYYRRSLADLLKRDGCARTSVIVSMDDKRVFDPVGVTDLRAAGCVVETPAGYDHWQADADPALNEHTIDLIAREERRRPIRQATVSSP